MSSPAQTAVAPAPTPSQPTASQPAAHPTAGHGHGHGGGQAPPQPSGETTHAIVFAEAGRLATHEASLRVAAPDEVVVDTKFSSISAGTERLLFSGKLPGFPMLRFPLVPGYESAGVVVRVGAAVTDIRVGDAVFVGGSMCFTDVAGVFGGNAARLIKKAAQVVPLNGIPLAHAPFLALAATSLHGVLRLGNVAGQRICVLGMGAIGQFAARFLLRAGASVVCADLRAERLSDAPEGCERLDLRAAPLDEALHDLDAIVEATGHSEEIARCARALRPGGTIALLSYYDELRTPYVDLFVKEISLLVAREWQHSDLLAARDALASGDISLGRMAEYVVPVAEYERAYRTAFEDPSVPKVILQWA